MNKPDGESQTENEDLLAGVDPDLAGWITQRCAPPIRKMYEHNFWIAFNVMGWKLGRDVLQNWNWETGDPVRPFWSDHSVNFWRSLDACAVAETKIAEMGLQVAYTCAIMPNEAKNTGFGMVTATSQQRCEAMYAIREQITKAKPTKAEG